MHAVVVNLVAPSGISANAQKSKLSDPLHERAGRSTGISPGAHAQDHRLISSMTKQWPRSAQYSSHLFSIMLRVQR